VPFRSDVERAALGLNRRVQSFEVGFVGDGALHRAGIRSEFGHDGIERFLPAAEDEDKSAFVDKSPCRGAADAGSAASDHGGLSIQFHVIRPLLRCYGSRECLPDDLAYRADRRFHHASPGSGRFRMSKRLTFLE
jgi:hypothetical protein